MKIIVFCFAAVLAVASAQPATAQSKQLFPPNGTCDPANQAVIGWKSDTGLTCTTIQQSGTSTAVGIGTAPVGSYALTIGGGKTAPTGGLVLPKVTGGAVDGSIWIVNP